MLNYTKLIKLLNTKQPPINYYGPVGLKMYFLKKSKLCPAVIVIKFGHYRLPYATTLRHNMAAFYPVRAT